MEIIRLTLGPVSTNTYIVHAHAVCYLIDPAADAPSILRECQRAGWSPDAVVLTHAHFDHMGALPAFSELPLYLHQDDADALSDPERNVSSCFGMPFRCDRTFLPLREGDRLGPFTVLHTPGHTPGSICLLGEGVLFSGDTLFAGGSCGRTDFPGGDPEALQDSLSRLLLFSPDLRVLPGHGPETTIGEEKRTWNAF